MSSSLLYKPDLMRKESVSRRVSLLAQGINKILSELKEDKEHEIFTINDLVKLIEDSFRNEYHVSIIISGKRGHGKTTLLAHILAMVYGTKSKPDYMKALNYIIFDPKEALLLIIDHVSKGIPLISIGMDDAGTWLSKWSQERSKTRFLEFSNLFRQVLGASLFTDVASIHKYVRQLADIRIHVKKLASNELRTYRQIIESYDPRLGEYFSNNRIEWSLARIYETSLDVFDRVWLKRKSTMLYPLILPKKFRRKYVEKRRLYTMSLAQRVLETILLEEEIHILQKQKMAIEKKIEKLKKIEEREKLNKELRELRRELKKYLRK